MHFFYKPLGHNNLNVIYLDTILIGIQDQCKQGMEIYEYKLSGLNFVMEKKKKVR